MDWWGQSLGHWPGRHRLVACGSPLGDVATGAAAEVSTRATAEVKADVRAGHKLTGSWLGGRSSGHCSEVATGINAGVSTRVLTEVGTH